MTPREAGFLLLTGKLGDPARKPLTGAQLRVLAQRARNMERPIEDRPLTQEDLTALGLDRREARQILALLEQEELLEAYLSQGAAYDCAPVTRASRDYPARLRQRLGEDSPGCLWGKGDMSMLSTPGVALVGSRTLRPPNLEFAREVGRQAAAQGLVLISGNARGADRAAQDSCLDAGGKVISIVADQLWRQPLRRNVLFLSEDGFDEAFTTQRALSRNRCIHALGTMTLVAQATFRQGGTWSGTVRNLRHGWSPVVCFRDGSDSARELERLGAGLVGIEELPELLGA